MQDEFLVHTREGEPCPSCGGPIARIVVGGRSTYFCPSCQVRLRRRPAVAVRLVVQRRSVMPGTTVKTEAIVLRSIRYGEADRILHLYSKARGRVGAIAKGARRPKSRFGGRLEPFFRLDLILHEGRGELLTVTNVATVDGYPRLRSSGPALSAGARACDAVLRLLDSAEPNPPAYNLLCRYLALLDDPAAAAAPPASRRRCPSGSSWRWSPASPRSWPPARAAARPSTSPASPAPPAGSSARAARRVVRALRGGAPLHGRGARRSRWPRRPRRASAALRQVERAVGETLEHHAHVQLARRRVRAFGSEALGSVALMANSHRSRSESAPGRRSSSPTWRPVLPCAPPRRGARQPAADAVPARPRPDRPLEGLPPPQAQDAGLRRPRGRPLPDPAHPHAGGLRDRPHGRPGARPQRGPDRGDRARPRPRPPALRPHRRGGARRGAARALRQRLQAQRPLAAGGRRAGARRPAAST